MKLNIPDFKTNFILLILVAGFTISCGTKKDVLYFQDVDMAGVSMPIKNYSPIIKSDDMLTINVSALDSDAARPFNLPVVSYIGDGGEIGRQTLQYYLVDANGNIEFPVLGKLKLAGLSRIQATDMITNMLKDYIKNPIVNIRITNFKVTVLGEVNRPGTYSVQNERITILEALGLAGDLTLYGNRHHVLVVREENGKKTYTRVDLASEGVFNSPVYYLVQNDVIYVQPNNSRIKSSTVGPNVNTTLTFISTLVTVAALIVSITR